MSSTDSEPIFNEQQLLVALIYPRITGIVTFLCGIFMFRMAWKRKDRLFHRLILGMAIHFAVTGIFLAYGTAAVPSNDENAIGNHGNAATCSAQGFILSVCVNSSMMYYCFGLSVYSYVGVLNNFQKEKYAWIEPYIHLVVHLFTLISSLALLARAGYSNNGYGFCTLKTNVCPACQVFRFAESVFFLVFPTVVMILLYCKTKRRQNDIYIEAKSVARQACVYLLAEYLVRLPFAVAAFIILIWNDSNQTKHNVVMLVLLNVSLFGLWTLLAYRYFSVAPTTAVVQPRDTSKEQSIVISNSTPRYIFRSAELCDSTAQDPKINTSRTYSFNIFDGTNSGGAFADFVFDGDEEDEQEDQQETEKWSTIQQHV